MRWCGCLPAPEHNPTARRYLAQTGADQFERIAGVGAVKRCNSRWHCPECGRRLGARDAQRLAEYAASAIMQGGSAIAVTLTVRHHRGLTWREVFERLTSGWHQVTRDGARRRLRRRGLVGGLRAVETTVSAEHGWHVHLHGVLIFDRPQWVADLRRVIVADWLKGVELAGGSALPGAQWVEPLKCDDFAGWCWYTLKGLASKDAVETTLGHAKGLARGMTIVELAELARSGDLVAMARWQEYERDTYRRRAVGWVCKGALASRYPRTAKAPELEREWEIEPAAWYRLKLRGDPSRLYAAILAGELDDDTTIDEAALERVGAGSEGHRDELDRRDRARYASNRAGVAGRSGRARGGGPTRRDDHGAERGGVPLRPAQGWLPAVGPGGGGVHADDTG